jgi:uncharacterized membrane protein YesL
MGAVRIAFTRAVRDWWYGLIPFAIINLMWFGFVVTVVAGPPATAALLVVARDSAIGQGTELSTFFYALRRYFWRSWGLGLVSAVGTVLLTFDLKFYSDTLNGSGLLFTMGIVFLLYVLVLWCEFLLLVWPLLVNHPDMELRHVVRNAAITTLRLPGANFVLFFLVLLLTAFSIYFAPFTALALGALVALMAQHYLNVQAPVLANFPPGPGEGPPPPPSAPPLWSGDS